MALNFSFYIGQHSTMSQASGINLENISLEELLTILAERYEAEISNTSGNLTTKKADNCWISS
ncbi:hypothetical protein BpHYR1_004689 [Brachionus plicatilis]|uniref:Uncharacterized protein n=1 Tax=Brachionus plicatilis TaxID=10195 RepID=A0A3M7R2U9_BRAPC|nr:hypothetical protein BpHYR1_004689 [Brachionus plicatilis]